MTTNQLKKLLIKIDACPSAKRWVNRQIALGKSPKEIWEKCRNGNYLCYVMDYLIPDLYMKYRYLRNERFSLGRYTPTQRNKIVLELVRDTVEYKEIHKAAIKFLAKVKYKTVR